MRHGEPLRVGPGADARDPALSPRGLRQVAAAAGQVIADGFDVLYASPLRRALQSAGVIAERTGAEIHVEEGLAEFDHKVEYLHYEDGADIWARYRAGDLTPWGTTLQEFQDRVLDAVERLADAHPGRHVLAVCHGGVINVVANHVMGVTDRVQLFPPVYASTSRFERDDQGTWHVRSLNETTLPAELLVVPA
ncbi:phosphoglycerate mutase [Actinomadura sp. NBRC 104425]|uniref:histidine phosphatase family protein n=1 Tax=Actinomadura sp. NBRC 104425 TaxID=3032204 RepID=UPI0024A4B73A|nr:histidine phosphatase family protein [Actinomadura sp. NBRC 104425]GLZ15941.1 phosphoglycerate mutase [Actinomadura sp. NBRC 104425]